MIGQLVVEDVTELTEESDRGPAPERKVDLERFPRPDLDRDQDLEQDRGRELARDQGQIQDQDLTESDLCQLRVLSHLCGVQEHPFEENDEEVTVTRVDHVQNQVKLALVHNKNFYFKAVN